ncbi:hypothetical protein EYZ11_006500 [Aspergillus tanneri]|uniref:Uncharacterized protein n=1 Tax=Aspergillus tanneri TaxID=1220188 RepID=A0A4S3JHS6_9EURO|nr:uncharacterized protein ATNIH1004_000136 [Aspergillus tanneri]KAA8651256.1 hypothetical protein ATNIH1004_000136 [Aspergillus tanneri]THC94028.1 hypothetical protein EYZ11_006500 [Aspergillus tanneri]
MKFFSTVAILATALLPVSNAWVLQVNGNGERNGSPLTETFSSRSAENNCHDISTTIQKKGVHDFKFCTIQMYGCEIKFFDGVACKGEGLGHSGGRGYSWTKYPVSKKGSTMKSFRITGCRADLPVLEKFKFDTFRIADC